MRIWNLYEAWNLLLLYEVWNLYEDLKPLNFYKYLIPLLWRFKLRPFTKNWNLNEDLKPVWRFETFFWRFENLYEDLKPTWRFESFIKNWNLYEDMKSFWRFGTFIKKLKPSWDFQNLHEDLQTFSLNNWDRRYLKPDCACDTCSANSAAHIIPPDDNIVCHTIRKACNFRWFSTCCKIQKMWTSTVVFYFKVQHDQDMCLSSFVGSYKRILHVRPKLL